MANNAKRVSTTEAELTIKLEWKDIQSKYDEELSKIVTKASIPGFRQGKAPRNLVEKKLGDGFLQEIAANAMDDALKVALEKVDKALQPLPYSTPALQDEEKVFPVKKNEDITFTVKYEIMPEFEVKNYKGIEVEYPNVTISDNLVDNEIERLREQNAILKDKDDAPIAEGDIVNVDYEAEGIKDSKRDSYVFTVGSHSSYFDFDDDIIGFKKGDEKTIEKKYEADKKPHGLEADSVKIKIKVNSVKSKELPKVDDEFAEDVNEKYKNVKDLKNGIKSNLESRLNDSMRETKISLLLDKMLPEIKLDIPKSMVDFEVANTFRRFSSQMGMSEGDAIKFLEANGQSLNDFTAPWRDDAEHTIKSQLVVSRVRDNEKFEVTEDEITKEIEKQFPNVSEDNKAVYKDIVKDNLEYQKAIDFLLKENKFVPSKEEVTYEDFASGAYLAKKEEKKETKKTTKKDSEDKGSKETEKKPSEKKTTTKKSTKSEDK